MLLLQTSCCWPKAAYYFHFKTCTFRIFSWLSTYLFIAIFFFCVRRYDNLCACKQPICGKCQQRQLTLCEINIPNTHSIYISCKNTIEHARLLHLPQGVCEKHFFGFHPHYSYNLFICSTALDLLNCSRNLCPFLAKVRYETQPADSHISTSVNTVTWSK